MKYLRGLALIVGFVFLCGFGGGGNSGGGGGGSSSCSGGGAVSNQFLSALSNGCAATLSQPSFSNLSGTAAANQGGTGNNLQYVVNDLGTTTTPACNWASGYICRFASTANATLTQSNIPGSPTAPIQVHLLAYVSSANAVITFPATVKSYSSGTGNATGSLTLQARQSAGGGAAFTDIPMWCDGTNCFTELGDTSEMDAPVVGVGSAFTVAGTAGFTGGGASAVDLSNGSLFSITGGTAPTATCSGGSTGVVVSAGNTSCTGSTAPFPCCTGSGTGTCSNSTDNKGTIQTSSSASTSCTITFNHTWPQTPMCVFDDGSSSITPTAFAAGIGTTTTYIFNFASTTSKVVNYVCM